jgi:hypothetical protein
MLLRLLGRIAGAVTLLAGAWALSFIPDSAVSSLTPVGAPHGPVRILRFYATTGSIARGDKTQLCYGVENAKSVRILPFTLPLEPVAHRCVEIGPERTTHYTILAEGFDGNIATRPLTLVVETAPAPYRGRMNLALLRFPGSGRAGL